MIFILSDIITHFPWKVHLLATFKEAPSVETKETVTNYLNQAQDTVLYWNQTKIR